MGLRISLVLATALLTAAQPAPPADWSKEIADFRAAEEKDIGGESGWTTLIGLHWLREGANRIGSGTTEEIPLPPAFPAHVGSIVFTKGATRFEPQPGTALQMNGKPVVAGPIRDNQDVFSIGTVRFNLIRRGARVAVRVRDSESDSRKKFTHLNWYAPDPSWRIEAKWIPFPQPKTLSFQTVIAGLREEMQAPGTAIFERAGKTYRLEPVVEDKELFYVFRDQTAGKTTYAAARYVYSDLPKDGKVIIDFNKATSPPCAFTSYATCPLPPPQNRLALAITAGETLYGTSKH